MLATFPCNKRERGKESEINAKQSTWNVTFFFIYVDLKMLMMMMTWVFSFEYFIVGQWLLMVINWWVGVGKDNTK